MSENCERIETEYRSMYWNNYNLNTILASLVKIFIKLATEWRWIDYSELKDIECLDKGGFDTVWKAKWIDMPEESQDPMTVECAIVLRYMKNGNLRNFLQQNKILSWTERLWLLRSFIKGLEAIHDSGHIHCDLHPGNLMISGDLGLCRSVNESKSSGIGIIMWLISTEKVPFSDRAYDLELTLEGF
ncbi:hypothetical protein Glove_51g101 [Diversispora epigaea]|uniref:Protein kinase domain-containing protein n=1 Tax=Diversispora epigaea TaxID=1348612 RepID=A0A397JKA7_9GLOM|nr:hypothetical protein Glove_51g101 [Diversispora epigaea]